MGEAKKKRILIGLILLLISLVTPTVYCYGGVNWKGVTWDGVYGASLSVVDETLMVRPLYVSSSSSSPTFGAAHRIAADISATTGNSNAASTHWIEITFIDDPKSAIQIWLSQIYEVYTEIGERDDSNNYMILLIDYRNRSQLSMIDTGIPRKQQSSTTTVKVKWQENKGIEYFIDGTLVYNDERIKLNDFGEIFLAAKNAVGTFVDYQTGFEDSLLSLPIDIDIKPGGDPNSINPKSKGKIPLAILSTMDFSAPDEVAIDTLTFGRRGDEESLAFCNTSPEDVNDDGLDDLVCHFYTQKTGFQWGDEEGFLRGQTLDGAPIEGSDSVRIVPSACKD